MPNNWQTMAGVGRGSLGRDGILPDRWDDRFHLMADSNLKTRFENDHMGVMVATSVGGVVTGRGGDRIVVDDPHNVRDAESETKRADVLRWWDKSMSTRFNDPMTGVRIVVMQRVHEDDLAGHVLEQGEYVHLNLPMEYEPQRYAHTGFGKPDPRTEYGELLAPNRVGPKEVQDLKLRLGSREYAGQFQQRPSPAEGGTFKRRWWRFWHWPGQPLKPVQLRLEDGRLVDLPVVELPTQFDETLQSWDMAFKETKGSDFVVGQAWALRRADRYLLDQVHDRLEFTATVAAVLRFSTKHPQIQRKLVEDKANGPAVISTLRRKLAGLIAVNPQGGKVARANAVTPEVESGNVYLPHPLIASWVDGFIEEAASFPTGKYDDQVDAMSQALFRFQRTIEERMAAPAGVEGLTFFGSATESVFPATGDWEEDDPWA